MRRVAYDTFDRPWLVLCEGDSDKKILDRVLWSRGGIPDAEKFHVQFPDRKGSDGGRNLFGSYLKNMIDTSNTFRNNVKAVIIVSDNDSVPTASFHEIQEELRKGGFPVPHAERTVAKKPNYPDTIVMMIPHGVPGNLETLCVEAAYSKWGVKTALDSYLLAVPANNWEIGPQSKMQMQCLLASHVETNPATSLGYLWAEPPEYHLPLDHQAFDDIFQFFSNLSELLGDQ